MLRTRIRNRVGSNMNAVAPVTIPETSPDRYLGGMAALNLPTGIGTGDWHQVQTFFRPHRRLSRSFISGVGCQTDTTDLLGRAGIIDCTQVVESSRIPHHGARVFAATHARAVADLVLAAVRRGLSPDFVVLDDYMPRPDDKREVFDLLQIAAAKLSANDRQQVNVWRTKQERQ